MYVHVSIYWFNVRSCDHLLVQAILNYFVPMFQVILMLSAIPQYGQTL